MKKTKVINSDISRVIAQMGHFDKLSIGDAGMPVPRTTEKIDLAVTNGVHQFYSSYRNETRIKQLPCIYSDRGNDPLRKYFIRK